ncbi:Glyoxalase/Bleomycin resistance protein/Dihydroxybiphenyl dioxygenase [Geranomyces variabilis]|nr:Glyoxalase/Bleomycin resistance protein/Dihydroxybiphenyl dioxygenase [Geranomyces variabilis]KAJ3135489.1 hypothetical protein HDU90_003891 [Geranomyces variabilis]
MSSPVDSIQSILASEHASFLTRVVSSLQTLGISLPPNYAIDHICYRTSTTNEYMRRKAELATLGTLLVENDIGGRLIACYKLHAEHALRWPQSTAASGVESIDRVIDVVELPAPKPGRLYPSGLEHVEVVVDDMSLEDFAAWHQDVKFDWSGMKKPINRDLRIDFREGGVEGGGFSVKFHEQTLEKVIEIEKAM